MTEMPTADWRQLPMTPRQIMLIVLCGILSTFDGLDILSISYAAPGIAQEWGVGKAALGVVLSMELLGMAVGAVALGKVADRFGRKIVVIICLTIMSVGMWAAIAATTLTQLSLVRLMTGLGIGGMIATIYPMAAEFSSVRARHISVALLGFGWPVASIVGGALVSTLVPVDQWRWIFLVGAMLSTLFLPIVIFWLPESITYLLEKQPANALERANAILLRIGHAPLRSLPRSARPIGQRSAGPQGSYRDTAILTIAYFFDMLTFYYLLKWAPKIMSDLGFDFSTSASILIWGGVGQMAVMLFLATLVGRFSVRPLCFVALLLTAVSVSSFGLTGHNVVMLCFVMAVSAFFNMGANLLLSMVILDTFPTEIRTSRTGLVMGLGRGGAALSPILAGFLLSTGMQVSIVSIALSVPVLVTALLVSRWSPLGQKSTCDLKAS